MDKKREIALETYGVCLELTYESDLAGDVEAILPPRWVPCQAAAASVHFGLERLPSGRLRAAMDGKSLVDTEQLPLALDVLDAQMRAFIALHAPAHVFVHAGVVGVDGRAALLPGSSFAGKTTLVAALVGQGAEYLSDEFAVLDPDGLVHPYPKPLSIRRPGTGQSDEVPAAAFGGDAGDRALNVDLIVNTTYVPGATWAPRALSPGAAALVLLENTVPARSRPDESLTAVRSAACGARAFQTERGEAGEAARAILALVG